MKIAVIADSGPDVGYGHAVRMYALTDELTYNNSVSLSNSLDNGLSMVERQRYDCVIVDSYRIDDDQFAAIKNQCSLLCYIDDLGRCPPMADIIINGAYRAEKIKYDARERQVLLLGAQYCLLRKEFRDLPPKEIRPQVERILVMMGGTNTGLKLAVQIMKIIEVSFPDIEIEIINKGMNASEIIQKMQWTDLAISHGGMTIYELLACGVPTITIQTADNQIHNITFLCGSHIWAAANIGELISSMWMMNLFYRKYISQHGQQLIDGHGAERIEEEINKLGVIFK